MKLDKIRFARLISYLSPKLKLSLSVDDMEQIDYLCQVDLPQPVPQPDPFKGDCKAVDELLRQIANPDGYIPAIKAYRVLTGAGLKEAKQAIDRYRVANAPAPYVPEPKNAPGNLGDILRTATREVIND